MNVNSHIWPGLRMSVCVWFAYLPHYSFLRVLYQPFYRWTFKPPMYNDLCSTQAAIVLFFVSFHLDSQSFIHSFFLYSGNVRKWETSAKEFVCATVKKGLFLYFVSVKLSFIGFAKECSNALGCVCGKVPRMHLHMVTYWSECKRVLKRVATLEIYRTVWKWRIYH